MCSLNDYNYNDNVCDSTKNLLIDTTLCRKCKKEHVDVLLNNQGGYCKTCFLTVTHHKFRTAFGKSRITCRDELILVDFSTELNAIVLLHLIKSSKSMPSFHKKLTFNTKIVHIDDGAVMRKTNEERSTLRYKISEQIKEFGFDGYFVSLSQVLNKEEDTLNICLMSSTNCQINNENDERLHKLFLNLRDDTSRTDLLHQLRRKLLISVARKVGCNKIFVADSVMNIAERVLGDLCLGRGAQLSSLATFCDSTYSDISILKPIRDFTKQELDYYAKYFNLNPIKLEGTDVITTTNSVQALVHNFTVDLESQFSGTVSAIFRTAEKVSAKNNKYQDMEDNCVLCEAKLLSVSSNNVGVSALRAVEISRSVSRKYIHEKISSNNIEYKESDCMSLQSDSEKCSNDNGECSCKHNKKVQLTPENIWRCLCYSCKMIFQDTEIMHILPEPLLCAIQQRLALKTMREEINDFLL